MPIIKSTKSTSLVERQQVEILIEVDEEPEEILIEVAEEPEADVNKGFDPYKNHASQNNAYQNTRDGSAQKAAQKATQNVRDFFGEGITLARQCANDAIENFRQMHDTVKPDEFELQLGIKVGSKAGAFITAHGEGQIQVKMKWKLKETPQELKTQDTSQQLVNSVPK